MTISKSPNRHTFQLNNYIERCKEDGNKPDEDYLQMWGSVKQRDDERMLDPEWQKHNLEYDLRSTDWILEKVRGCDIYAQHLYAAMCNNEFQKHEVFPVLKNEKWSCSWRYAGGIIADMREKGDYIDWYCSGITNVNALDDDQFRQLPKEQQEGYLKLQAYVAESVVTEEVREDLKKLNWMVLDSMTDDL